MRGDTYDMDQGFVDRAVSDLALVYMGWEAGDTISHVYTTFFILEVSEVCKVCTFYHRVRANTYDMDHGFVNREVSANEHW